MSEEKEIKKNNRKIFTEVAVSIFTKLASEPDVYTQDGTIMIPTLVENPVNYSNPKFVLALHNDIEYKGKPFRVYMCNTDEVYSYVDTPEHRWCNFKELIEKLEELSQ